MKIALNVLNSDYCQTPRYSDLQGVTKDGDLMHEMLKNCCDEVKIYFFSKEYMIF